MGKQENRDQRTMRKSKRGKTETLRNKEGNKGAVGGFNGNKNAFPSQREERRESLKILCVHGRVLVLEGKNKPIFQENTPHPPQCVHREASEKKFPKKKKKVFKFLKKGQIIYCQRSHLTRRGADADFFTVTGGTEAI